MAKQTKKGDRPLPKEHWKDEPDEHDYPAALDYLTLLLEEDRAQEVVARLQLASIVHKHAKDLLRASRLPLLPSSNPHVSVDLDTVRQGGRLSPILLVRGSIGDDVALTVADGYHRICASYTIEENAEIPCRIVGLDAG